MQAVILSHKSTVSNKCAQCLDVQSRRSSATLQYAGTRIVQGKFDCWSRVRGCRGQLQLCWMDRYTKLEPFPLEGRYYKARDNRTNQFVCLKSVRFDCEGIPYNVIREISNHKTLSGNKNHPNIVQLKEVVLCGKKICIIFDYLENTLHQQILLHRATGGMATSMIKMIAFQILNGLSFCHKMGVLHRDLKPHNILMDRHGGLKLASFSISRSFTASLTLTREVVTLWYRCPEVLLGAKHYSDTIDMWSFGCVLSELATSEPMAPGMAQIDQLHKIFRLVGTPTEETWPGVAELPDYSPLFPRWAPGDLAAAHPRLDSAGVALLSSALACNPERRITAAAAMDMEYMHDVDDR